MFGLELENFFMTQRGLTRNDFCISLKKEIYGK